MTDNKKTQVFEAPDKDKWNLPETYKPIDITDLQLDYSEIKDIIPHRGTEYMIRMPKNWNGTLLSNLDYIMMANTPLQIHLLSEGYALSGLNRRPERMTDYDPAHEMHDFISVFDIFEQKFGKPNRTIQLGCSGGGTVSIAMAETHPDRIDGAIAACASTSPWMANTHLDALFVLKALIAPKLPIAGLPLHGPEIEKFGAEWQKAIKNAQQTPEGRARIALAITIGQWQAWGGFKETQLLEPNPNDVKALQESMYYCLTELLPSETLFGTTMLELAGKGQLKSNVGIDYEELYLNGDDFNRNAVEILYKKANLDLETDLKNINAFPRISSDSCAIKYWSAPGRTHIGQPKVPLLRIHTIGDGLVYPAMAQGYEDLVKENGYSELYRSAYVNRWGHCTFSMAEWLVAIETMTQRLDNGEWPNTESEALNKLGTDIMPKGDTRFSDFRKVKKYNRTWCPSVQDYKGDK